MSRKGLAEKISAEAPQPCIWAVGGGKGGVGKSVVTSNLAVALARSGMRCVLVDADLGGANLHTLFGIANPGRTLADLISHRASSLSEVLTPTPVPNLQLISSARPLLEMANPHHQQKWKIIRQIFTLEADYVLLDLGAGSAFNVLDFFLPAHEQLIVVTPMPTSVENAYHFLKASYYRQLKAAVRNAGLSHHLDRLIKERRQLDIRSPRDLASRLEALGGDRGAVLSAELKNFHPRIVVNQVRGEEDAKLGVRMARAARDYFDADIGFLGNIPNDDHVYHAVQGRKPVLELYPQAAFSMMVRRLCAQLSTSGREANGQGRACQGFRNSGFAGD